MALTRFCRARRPEQKEQRRNEILDAAATLLEDGGLEAVTLSAIGRSAGVAKSALYRYFESREQIMLQLLEQDWEEWVGEVERELASLAGAGTPESVAVVLTRATAQRPRLCQLVSVLSSVLERNLTEEAVLDFKLGTLGTVVRMVNALHAALPDLSLEASRRCLFAIFACIAGLWPMTNPSPVVAKVMERPEMADFHKPFDATFEGIVRALIAGNLADPTPSKST